jgi:sugar/nucleoside kinase (ribokinase family)
LFIDMKQIKSQVVVAGHICLDIIPEFHSGDYLPEPGQLVQVGPANVSTGGPVSNTGLALFRLGIDTKLMGKVGQDAFGGIVLDLVKAWNPKLSDGIIVVDGETTSYSVVLNLPDNDRSFLHCPGANDTFCSEDLKFEDINQTRLFHFGYPPLMAGMYADDGRDLENVFYKAKSAGATTSLDMVMVKPHSAAGQADWEKILRRTLPHVDFFLPSIEELLVLLHRSGDERSWLLKGDKGHQICTSYLRELAEMLLEYGAGVIVFKLGTHGMYMRTSGMARLNSLGAGAPQKLENWANREILAPIFEINYYGGTTGAGDSAIAGFIAALLRGRSPEEVLMYACAVGACNVEAADALSGLQTWEETELRIKNGWRRLPTNINEQGWSLDPASETWLGPFDCQS